MFEIEKIREQFPILEREVYGRKLIYLDSGATAQKPISVIERTDALMRKYNANIHRGVHHLSGVMTEMYEQAREKVLQLARELTPWCGRLSVFIVPFTEIQEEIRRKCPTLGARGIFLREIMLWCPRWSITRISCLGSWRASARVLNSGCCHSTIVVRCALICLIGWWIVAPRWLLYSRNVSRFDLYH